ncbi:Presenilin [Dirofilaria immitis]|nr:Presenilin [Dirofilaria immitis]
MSTQQTTSNFNEGEAANETRIEQKSRIQAYHFIHIYLSSIRFSNKQHPSRYSHSRKDTNSEIVGNATNEANIDEEEAEFKYGAQHVIHLFVPVSICMVFVIFTMNTVGYYTRKDGQYLIYTPFTKETDSTSEKIMMSFGNAFIILGVVMTMTIILILLYKFRFYRVINAWLILSSLILLSLFTFMYLQEVFKSYNIPVDYILICIFIWNYGVMGMICIHWKGPLRMQQGYLIMMSALMALIFIKYLPEWTVWTVLAVISIWDLIAVLCPKGPLRILVETAQERNEPIFPALIYSSGLIYAYTLIGAVMMEQDTSCVTESARSNSANPGSSSSSTDSSMPSTAELLPTGDDSEKREFPQGKIIRRFAPTRAISGTGMLNTSFYTNCFARCKFLKNSDDFLDFTRHVTESLNRDGENGRTPYVIINGAEADRLQNPRLPDEKGIKLGLGDFIFYSVLVGKASSYGDWNTTIACYVAILIGLCFTLILLAVFRKALPALPISIFSGLIFYFCTRGIITPFCTSLSVRHLIY